MKNVLQAIRDSTGLLPDLCRIVLQFRGVVRKMPTCLLPPLYSSSFALDDRSASFSDFGTDVWTLPGLRL